MRLWVIASFVLALAAAGCGRSSLDDYRDARFPADGPRLDASMDALVRDAGPDALDAPGADVPGLDAPDAPFPPLDAPRDTPPMRDAPMDSPIGPDAPRDATFDTPFVPDAPRDARIDAPPVICGGDTDCDDGLVCNGRERCVAGRCSPGTPLGCVSDRCNVGTCSEAAGGCDRHDPERQATKQRNDRRN